MHFSIIIPVLNEETVLEATLARLTRQAGGQHYELIIVDGGSSDSTVAIAVVAGAFRLCFNCDRWPYRLVAYITNLRSLVRKVFTGDQAYFMRASSFRASGGYPDQPLMEDLEIIARLRKRGKVILLSQYVITSARRHEKMGLLRSVLFMWYLRTLYRFGVSPAQLRRMYVDVR